MASNVVITMRPDLAYGLVVDALKVAAEAIELIPEWNTMEREELQNKLNEILKVATENLRVKK